MESTRPSSCQKEVVRLQQGIRRERPPRRIRTGIRQGAVQRIGFVVFKQAGTVHRRVHGGLHSAADRRADGPRTPGGPALCEWRLRTSPVSTDSLRVTPHRRDPPTFQPGNTPPANRRSARAHRPLPALLAGLAFAFPGAGPALGDDPFRLTLGVEDPCFEVLSGNWYLPAAKTGSWLDYYYPEISSTLSELPHSAKKWDRVYAAVKKLVPQSKSDDIKKLDSNMSKPQNLSHAGQVKKDVSSEGRTLSESERAANYKRLIDLARSV